MGKTVYDPSVAVTADGAWGEVELLRTRWSRGAWDDASEDERRHVYMAHASFPYFLHHIVLPFESETEGEDWPETLPKFMFDACLTAQSMTEFGAELARAGIIKKRPAQHQLLYMLPMGHFKTTMLAVAFPLWLIVRDLSVTILMASCSSSIASDRISRIIDHIETNEAFIDAFGDLRPTRQRDSWTADEATVNRERRRQNPTLRAFGIGSSVTGVRADYAIVDDAVIRENISTPAQRDRVKTFITSTVHSRLSGRRRVLIVIGTSYHFGDAYQQIDEQRRQDGSWVVVRKPAILNDDKVPWPPLPPDGKPYTLDIKDGLDFSETEVLWPEYWTAELLYEDWLKGKTIFSTERQNRPMDPESKLFPLEMLRAYCRADGGATPDNEVRPKLRRWNLGEGRPEPGDIMWREYAQQGIDLAGARAYVAIDFGGQSIVGRTDLDYTVFELWLYTKAHQRILVDVWRIQGFPTRRCVDTYKRWLHQYQPDVVLIESEQHQRVTAREWEREAGVPVRKVLMPRGKLEHAQAMRDLMEAGLLLYAGATSKCRRVMRPWEDELDAYPQGAHDDTIAAAIHFHAQVRPNAGGTRAVRVRDIAPTKRVLGQDPGGDFSRMSVRTQIRHLDKMLNQMQELLDAQSEEKSLAV